MQKTLIGLFALFAFAACQGPGPGVVPGALRAADPPAPAASPAPPVSASVVATAGAPFGALVSAGPNITSLSFPATGSQSATLTVTGSASVPAGDPAIQSATAFVTVTTSAPITFSTFPAAAFTLYSGATGGIYDLAYLPPGGSWQEPFETLPASSPAPTAPPVDPTPGPGPTGGPPYLAFPAVAQTFTMIPGKTYTFALYSP